MNRNALRFLVSTHTQTIDRPRFGRHLGADIALDAALVPTTAATTLVKPDEMDWRDWASFLLLIASEIEHSLLIQYLYAGYSLADQPPAGPHVPANAQSLLTSWRLTILRIAREEMAHLVTVQNLRSILGLPASLDREPFPYQSPLYPFPFELEPVSKHSLAKYVVAEMPADPDENIDDIIAEATGAAGSPVNRVGIVYSTLESVFLDPNKLADDDFAFDAAAAYQALPVDWTSGGGGNMIVDPLHSRDQAVAAIRQISQQGEGPRKTAPGDPPSHFERFLAIYRAFPDSGWNPATATPTNPATSSINGGSPITDPASLAWAKFANVRYRALLTCVAHAHSIPGPTDGSNGRTIKGNLIDWAFEEMAGRSKAGLGHISHILKALPLSAGGDPTKQCAALPFEMPYTTELPDFDKSRWRLHLSLLNASAAIASVLMGLGQSNDVLKEYQIIDSDRRTFVMKYLAA
jgi:hypothetical protein